MSAPDIQAPAAGGTSSETNAHVDVRDRRYYVEVDIMGGAMPNWFRCRVLGCDHERVPHTTRCWTHANRPDLAEWTEPYHLYQEAS